MHTNQHHEQGDAAMSLYAHQFDGLVIIYFDATGLKRGFQLWLGWPGGVDRLRNCLPLYFPPEVTSLGSEKRLKRSCNDTLVLICLARDGAFADQNIIRLAGVLQHAGPARRGLVVLFATRRSCKAWRRRWPLPGNLTFELGSYTVCPVSRVGEDEVNGDSCRYELRAVSPRNQAGERLPGRHPRVPMAERGRANS